MDAFAISLGIKTEENGGVTTLEFSGDLGEDNNRLIELIITDDAGTSQTPETPNTAKIDEDITGVERGAATQDFLGDDFLAFDLNPTVGGPGLTVGYVSDLTDDGNKILATTGEDVNEAFVLVLGGVVEKQFQRGDADGNEKINVSDAVWIIQVIVGNFTAAYDCEDALDADDNGVLEVEDAVPVLQWVFQRGSALDEPFLGCGTDPTADSLTCNEDHPACD
jgi:hypothetical protein